VSCAAIALSLEESGKQTKSLYPTVTSNTSQQQEPRKVRDSMKYCCAKPDRHG